MVSQVSVSIAAPASMTKIRRRPLRLFNDFHGIAKLFRRSCHPRISAGVAHRHINHFRFRLLFRDLASDCCRSSGQSGSLASLRKRCTSLWLSRCLHAPARSTAPFSIIPHLTAQCWRATRIVFGKKNPGATSQQLCRVALLPLRDSVLDATTPRLPPPSLMDASA